MIRAMVVLVALTTAASAQQARWDPRPSCVGGLGKRFTTYEPYPIQGTFYRRPDGSIFYAYGPLNETHSVDMACLAKLEEKPPIIDEPPGF